MKILVTTILVLNCWGALASVFPEDEASWQKRIDQNIDKNRKSDVILKIKVDPGILCKICFKSFWTTLITITTVTAYIFCV